MPHSNEHLFNIEESCSTIRSKLKEGCHSIHYCMTMMDCEVMGVEAELVIWNDVLSFQDWIVV